MLLRALQIDRPVKNSFHFHKLGNKNHPTPRPIAAG